MNYQKPFFSIIIPVYNVEKYLEECVNSVLSQSFDDYEIILIDDGSKDNSGKICDNYKQNSDKIIVIHQENGGLSVARNTGIKEAKGIYLCFIDSDDYWDKSSVLEILYNKCKNEEYDIIEFGHKYLNVITGEEHEDFKRNYAYYNNLSLDDRINQIIADGKLNISAWGYCISKKYINGYDLLFVPKIKSEDIEWAFRVYSHLPNVYYLDDRFYVYRYYREGSITSTIDYSHLIQYCNILEKANNDIVPKANHLIQFSLYSYITYHILICIAHANTKKMSNEQRQEINKRLSKLLKITYKYVGDKRIRIPILIYKIFGYKILCICLAFYLHNRRHRSDGSIIR